MTVDDPRVLKWALYGIQQEKAELEAKMAELEEAERDIQQKMSAPDDVPEEHATPESIKRKELRKHLWHGDLMVHELAEKVLQHTGDAMKIPEMIDFLQENGYESDRKRQSLINSFYTAMNRKPETFQKIDTGVWSLVAWGKGAKSAWDIDNITEPEMANTH